MARSGDRVNRGIGGSEPQPRPDGSQDCDQTCQRLIGEIGGECELQITRSPDQQITRSFVYLGGPFGPDSGSGPSSGGLGMAESLLRIPRSCSENVFLKRSESNTRWRS